MDPGEEALIVSLSSSYATSMPVVAGIDTDPPFVQYHGRQSAGPEALKWDNAKCRRLHDINRALAPARWIETISAATGWGQRQPYQRRRRVRRSLS